ncbi:unnamed protein product [Caenorhabditis sp. 36 PRJEB53466]|nr:unnamed protein product [Caenorhabditis sp. 36 PRJEB53466]
MRQDEWDEFQHNWYRVSAVLALLTNSILVHLVLCHSPKSLGTYKYLMVCICIFEVVYESLDLAASPDMYTKDSAFLVVVSDKKSPFPAATLLIINLSYCACFGISLAIFAVHFVYRYLVIIGHKEWIRRSLRNIVFWLVAPLIFGGAWVLTARVFISPEPFLDDVLRKEMISQYGMGVESIAYVGPYFYPTDRNGTKMANWKAIHGMILFVVMIVTSLFTMVYFGLKSYVAINSAVPRLSQSVRFKSLQSQLLYALILQTIIPLTLMHVPISICFLIPYFEYSKEVFGRFLTISIAVYPVLDPLPNMFLIKDYRNVLKKRMSIIMAVPTEVSTLTFRGTTHA